MQKKLKSFILLALFLCLGLGVFAQISQGPPTPYAASQGGNGSPSDCTQVSAPDSQSDDKPDHENPPPPPPGLCLPINEYLLPLFMGGLFLGSFFLYRIEATKEKL
ncbi:MAG: hypothetical protein WBL27_09790 [Salinimicrobium sp.]